MRISQLAERCGVPATTLRFYQSAGLLSADRTPAGYRMYGEDAVERLAFIGAAKHLGLPLEEIVELLAVWQAGACKDVKADLRPRIAARLAEAELRAAEPAAFTASLHTALHRLDALPDRAEPCDPGCGFLTPAQFAGHRSVDVLLSPSRQAAEQDAERWRSAPVACSLTGDGLSERTVQWHQPSAAPYGPPSPTASGSPCPPREPPRWQRSPPQNSSAAPSSTSGSTSTARSCTSKSARPPTARACARAVARGSTRRNRPAMRAMAWSNIARQRAGSTLRPAAIAPSSGVHTTSDDHAVAAPVDSRTVHGNAESR
ncbi:MerR family transcriptional regulator [Streptomyces sp. NPDC058247]|uniref:MerR family transcriptional regulator n=1 Tax=Streptomyces sp. NPDC058247 TaxID=3346401 RepID=UPI0036E3CFD5